MTRYRSNSAAYRARKKREYEARSARLRADSSIIEHGTLNGYNNYGCRCSDCAGKFRRYKGVARMHAKPTQRKLPEPLCEIAAGVSTELADLIQEQYDDDQATRAGFANRLPTYDGPMAQVIRYPKIRRTLPEPSPVRVRNGEQAV